ncbi:MAG: glycosyltransferase family 4 protein [Prevotellaceae bacterium]|jgi:glycosyltransferase involved in cell wall biosynthesis|nr:glycosyltransferase family 4 protein [Prevotellaceae bacterium]
MKLNKRPRIIIITTIDSFFLSHRKNLGLFLLGQGWDVCVMAPLTQERYAKEIVSLGFEFIPISLERSKTSLNDLKLFVELYKAYKQVNPDLIMAVALKPILWGGIVARLLNIPLVSAVSGLGFLFTGDRKTRMQKMLIFGLKYLLPKKNHHFIFQNDDDKNIFLANKITVPERISMIRGMGVDLDEYKPIPFENHSRLRFLFPARMLKDKGLLEFIEAAKKVGKQTSNAEFILAGDIDQTHPTGVSEEELRKLIANSSVSWIGYQKNMIPVYGSSDVVILPSYREGFPKVLIEAAAIGRPIITTDVPGCRDAVKNGINGYLVPAKNADKLAEAMLYFINNEALKNEMGQASVQLAKDFYDSAKINRQFSAIFKSSILQF